MKRLFACVAVIIGIWLIISPWLLGYRGTLAQWEDSLIGLAIIILSLIVIVNKAVPTPDWPQFINSILGIWLIVSGIFFFGRISTASLTNDIVSGFLIALFSVIATQVREGIKSFVYTKDNNVLLEMSRMNYKNGLIEMKGKNFGTMPATMYVRPEDLWNVLGLVPLELILKMPKLLYKGWRKSKEIAAAKVAK